MTKKKVQKEEKGYVKIINLVTLLLLSTILIPESLAADPGHAAQAISKGMFESGNYAFPDSLFVCSVLAFAVTLFGLAFKPVMIIFKKDNIIFKKDNISC